MAFSSWQWLIATVARDSMNLLTILHQQQPAAIPAIMPFKPITLSAGIYILVNPDETVNNLGVLCGTVHLMEGNMCFRREMLSIMSSVGKKQSEFPNVLCTPIAVGAPRDESGRHTSQGVFFSFRNGIPGPGENQFVQGVLRDNDIPHKWLHLHAFPPHS